VSGRFQNKRRTYNSKSTDNTSDSCDKTHIENKTERCVPIHYAPLTCFLFCKPQ